jgi:hypothetical protein
LSDGLYFWIRVFIFFLVMVSGVFWCIVTIMPYVFWAIALSLRLVLYK